MNKNLTHRKAALQDLASLIFLLADDEFGGNRELSAEEIDPRYIKAFHQIDADPHQYLMVVENEEEMIGTCHLTIMPSLTLIGSTRMQIEAVRIHQKYRGQTIGTWMIQQAIEHGKTHGATIIQLTTNKKRPKAKQFYEQLGFVSSHEGMKLQL